MSITTLIQLLWPWVKLFLVVAAFAAFGILVKASREEETYQ